MENVPDSFNERETADGMQIVNGTHPTRMPLPKNHAPSRILIVADLQIARIGIARMLRDCTDFVVCGEADSPRTLESIAELKPSLLLIDLMPSGRVELIKSIVTQYPHMPVVAFSIRDI